jgi:hypothetical protein
MRPRCPTGVFTARQRLHALPAAPGPQARAGEPALQGSIASPPAHKEPSSWRPHAYQAPRAGAILRHGSQALVAYLRLPEAVCRRLFWLGNRMGHAGPAVDAWRRPRVQPS